MHSKRSLAALAGAAVGLAAGRLVDAALIGGGVATAAGAVAFAGYMTMGGAHPPLINGMQYLDIFAQPSRGVPARAVAQGDIDMSPVGALGPRASGEVAGYALVGAQARFAWLREGNRIFAVRPGDDVPRLGHIGAIERRDGRWALIDENGATLIESALAELAPSPGGKFDKRMIFESPPR